MLLSLLIAKALYLLPFLAIGLIAEAALSRRTVPAPSSRLNLGVTVLFWLGHFTVNTSLALVVVRTVSRLPHAPLMAIPTPASALGVFGWSLVLLFAHDFFYYWLHRAQHTIPWLWAQHALHHADETMNVTTTWRNHWTEPMLQTLCIVAPSVYLFSADARIAVVLALLSDGMAVFIHANINLPMGQANGLVAHPRWHRVHHSSLPEHFDKNFSTTFPLFDRLFGTYCAVPDVDPPTGLHTGERATTLASAAIFPITMWRAMRSRRHVEAHYFATP